VVIGTLAAGTLASTPETSGTASGTAVRPAPSGATTFLELLTYDRKGAVMVGTQGPVDYAKDAEDSNAATGWVGWVFYAGIIMFTGGFINLIEGIVALVRDDYYLVQSDGLIVSVDYTAWGWTLLIFGLLLVLVGYGVMVGQTWAGVIGVVLAVANTLLNMVFMPAYPIWAVIAITINVLVIYALAVHGREAAQFN
jgi:hypothetical protein